MEMLFVFFSLQLVLDVFASEVKKICILNIFQLFNILL